MADQVKNVNKSQSNEDATAKANAAKGAALAVLIVKAANEEQADQLARGQKRMRFVLDISCLTHEGHVEFRKDLQNELAFMAEAAKEFKEKGLIAEDETDKAGYSSNSFRVMVSCFRTISAACEMGWKLQPADMSWDQALSECRAYKRAKADAGVSVAIEGTRKAGGGRKVTPMFAKAQKAVAGLSRKEKLALCQALAGELGLTFAVKAEKQVEAAATV